MTVEYEGNTPVRVDAVVVSTQHSADVSLQTIRADLIDRVIRPEIPAGLMDDQTKIYVNPTGRFVIGGPQGDSGLTGRKIIVDTYGGYIGVAHPVSVLVDTEGTGVVSDDRLAEAVRAVFDFRPAAIIGQLGLRRPIYRQLAAYGHIGREDLGVSWEKTDKTAALRARLGL